MKVINKNFVRVNLYTIIAVYLLILVGGIVRNMGAGMGCPDWPKCFGSYIPPSSSDGLPAGYEEIYKERRLSKNMKLSNLVSTIGFEELGKKILNDSRVGDVTYYDSSKAWIEYINRLVGVLIGFLVLLNLIFSWKIKQRNIKLLGLGAFVLVLFQGWIGSLVVSTNFLPGFISFHMFVAILLVVLLLIQRFKYLGSGVVVKNKMFYNILIFLYFFQVFLGVQVREQIDNLNHAAVGKVLWIDGLNWMFYLHRSFSIVLILMTAFFIYQNRKVLIFNKLIWSFGILVVLEVVLGVLMNYLSFPFLTQPFHLFLGTVTFGLLFYLFLQFNNKTSRS
jgi:heme a synthase